MQYGMAGNTAFRQSSIAEGLPGRLTIRLLPRIPAVWRDRIAVGTNFSEARRINSPKPGIILPHTASRPPRPRRGRAPRGRRAGGARGGQRRGGAAPPLPPAPRPPPPPPPRAPRGGGAARRGGPPRR